MGLLHEKYPMIEVLAANATFKCVWADRRAAPIPAACATPRIRANMVVPNIFYKLWFELKWEIYWQSSDHKIFDVEWRGWRFYTHRNLCSKIEYSCLVLEFAWKTVAKQSVIAEFYEIFICSWLISYCRHCHSSNSIQIITILEWSLKIELDDNSTRRKISP